VEAIEEMLVTAQVSIADVKERRASWKEAVIFKTKQKAKSPLAFYIEADRGPTRFTGSR
jgi:hypothetical protein